MRAIGIGIAHALDDCDAAIFVERIEAAECGIETDAVVDFEYRITGDANGRADAVIRVVRVGDDGVEAIVAAAHLDDEQHVAWIDRRSECWKRLCVGGGCEKGRHRSAEDGDAE